MFADLFELPMSIRRKILPWVAGVGYAGIPTIICYETFNLIASHKGLQTLNALTIDAKEPSFDGLLWMISATFVVLETGTNISLVSPRREAKRLLDIRDETSGLTTSLLGVDEGELLTAVGCSSIFGVITAPLAAYNFCVVSCANLVPIAIIFGVNFGSVSAMIAVFIISFVYQTLLIIKDVYEAYDECMKGLDSVYLKVWQLSPLQFFRCFFECLVVTNTYYAVLGVYVVRSFFKEALGIARAPVIFQLFAVIGSFLVVSSRAYRGFLRYLLPFADAGGRGGYDFSLADGAHADLSLKLSCKNKCGLYFRASFYAIIQTGLVLYFTDKYFCKFIQHEIHQKIVTILSGCLVGVGTFAIIFKSDLMQESNRLASSIRNSSDGEVMESDVEDSSPTIRLLAFLCNLGSQTTRAICGVTFFIGVLDLPDILDDVVISFMVTLIVGMTNFKYYEPKVEKSLVEFTHWSSTQWARLTASRPSGADDDYIELAPVVS